MPMTIKRNFIDLFRLMAVLGGIGLLLVGSLQEAQAAGSVTLAWNPSVSPGIAGYRLYYGTTSGSYPQVLDVGNTTTATLSGLTPGQTYHIVVTSYDTAGIESLPSNEVTFTNGRVNLVWQNSTTGEHSIWVMQNGVPSSVINLPTIPVQWRVAATGDFLGNGQVGLVWENSTTGEHSIWVMQNGVLSSVISLPTIPVQWHVAAAADFLGTGQAGLVWENSTTGEHSIWVMQNGVVSSTIGLPTIPVQWHIAAAADFLVLLC